MMMVAAIGKRVRLISTNYLCGHGELRQGDQGVITDVTTLPKELGGKRQFWVKWDSGFSVALIENEDRFEVLTRLD